MKAFPSTTPLYSPEKGTMIGRQEHGGMELRDWFAGLALNSMYTAYCNQAQIHGWDENWKTLVAKDCYTVADAMMEAKNAKTKE